MGGHPNVITHNSQNFDILRGLGNWKNISTYSLFILFSSEDDIFLEISEIPFKNIINLNVLLSEI